MPDMKLAGMGAGVGSWRYDTSNGSQFLITGATRDLKPGGNPIYYHAQTQKSSGWCAVPTTQYVTGSCNQDFYKLRDVHGEKYNSGEWRRSSRLSPYDIYSKGHRIAMRICENQRFSPDDCSVWGVSPASHWFK